MDNYTKMKPLSVEDMSHFLCASMEYLSEEEYYPCEKCPMREKCSEGCNGWLTWLKEETR